MAEIFFTKRAVADLGSIWDYTCDKWSEHQADKYYSKLMSATRRIVVGDIVYSKKYNVISSDLYGYKVGSHIIFYKNMTSGTVLIIRILHKSMDLRSHLDFTRSK